MDEGVDGKVGVVIECAQAASDSRLLCVRVRVGVRERRLDRVCCRRCGLSIVDGRRRASSSAHWRPRSGANLQYTVCTSTVNVNWL